MSDTMQQLEVTKSIQQLRDWQKQIIHGNNCFGDIADMIERLTAEKEALVKARDELRTANEILEDEALARVNDKANLRADRDKAIAERDQLRAQVASLTADAAAMRAVLQEVADLDTGEQDCIARDARKALAPDSGKALLAALKVAKEALECGSISNVNGYNFATLMEDAKQLLARNGGHQNCYAISQAVETQKQCAEALAAIAKELHPGP